ncbi:MAG: aldehyde ferredoxin oxidoreductase family protein [Chloroflexi bacterium]|nr:aldehyde ferredoxin oxidoreductase family protein [Chloroflexota bacterium]
MAKGYAGKILRVNLTSGNLTVEEPDELFYRRYVGGAGLVAYYLLKEVPPGVDALSPENKLVFALGPLTGTIIAGASRSCVGGKSPLTDGFGKSEVGGFWNAELKKAGFDAIIVEGRASHPVYLWIRDGQAEIRDAGHLWGLPTKETQEAIRSELGDRLIRTALIGRAGEKMVRFSSVINDVSGHAAGRTGMGAVMGSKNLKGIAARGSHNPEVADPAKVAAFAKFMATNAATLARSFREYGTGAGMVGGNASGNLPVRNYSDGFFEEVEEISAETLKSKIGVGMESCYACPIRCKKVVEAEQPFKVDRAYGGPEYEALGSFGSACGVGDVVAISKANELCNAHAMDAISCGMTIAFAMECFEKGIITTTNTGGIDLRFGNGEALVRMTELIVNREGLGDILAEGSRRAAQLLGRRAQDLAMQVKGQELPMHEPRLKQGLGLNYAILSQGADHTSSLHDTMAAAEGSGIQGLRALGILDPLPPNDLGPAKVAMVRTYTNWRNYLDSLLVCMFVPWSIPQVIEIAQAVTGWNTSTAEGLAVGERMAQLARTFNVRDGKTADDDILPKRFSGPTPRGALKNTAIDPEAFAKAKRLYYRQMGWTEEGVPTQEKLAELGLAWANDMVRLPLTITI